MTWFGIDDGPPRTQVRPMVESEGMRMALEPGWEIRIRKGADEAAGGKGLPVLHAATVPIPRDRGDFGSGLVETLGIEDAFLSIVEYGEEAVGTALFPVVARLPGMILPDEFDPSQLQRAIAGQAGLQRFFTLGDRAFCVYTVVGAFSRRAFVVPKVRGLLGGLEIQARSS
ncbi:MAG: hypothetical protein WD651_12660 [Acidimicrobiia bacterium]